MCFCKCKILQVYLGNCLFTCTVRKIFTMSSVVPYIYIYICFIFRMLFIAVFGLFIYWNYDACVLYTYTWNFWPFWPTQVLSESRHLSWFIPLQNSLIYLLLFSSFVVLYLSVLHASHTLVFLMSYIIFLVSLQIICKYSPFWFWCFLGCFFFSVIRFG